MIVVFISALAASIGVIFDKIILTRRHLSVHVMAPLQFLFLFLITAIIVPWIGRFDIAQALTPAYFGLFIAMVGLSGIWNVIYYRGIKNESIQEVELIIVFTPLMTALLTALFLPEERNIHVLIALVAASLALIGAHIKRHHLAFEHHAKWLMLGVFLIALESVVIKQLLYVWSPASLYMARTLYVFIFFYFLARPRFDHLTNKSVVWIIMSALAGVIFMVTKFYGYKSFGIIYTTLVLALEPSLTLLLDKVFLHENIKFKYVAATLFVIMAVIYGTITR